MYGSSFLSGSGLSGFVLSKISTKAKNITEKLNGLKLSRSRDVVEVAEVAPNEGDQIFIGPKSDAANLDKEVNLTIAPVTWHEVQEETPVDKSVPEQGVSSEEEEPEQEVTKDGQFVSEIDSECISSSGLTPLEAEALLKMVPESIEHLTESNEILTNTFQQSDLDVILKLIITNKVITFNYTMPITCTIQDVRALVDNKWLEENKEVLNNSREGLRRCKIKYVDSEGDWITVELEDEWSEAKSSHPLLIELYAW